MQKTKLVCTSFLILLGNTSLSYTSFGLIYTVDTFESHYAGDLVR